MATLNASFQLNLHFITYAAYELKKIEARERIKDLKE